MLDCVLHMPLSAMLVVRTPLHTCNLEILQSALESNLAIEVYAAAQTLVTVEVYACHGQVVGWVCSRYLVTAEACASESQETVGSVPTVAAGKIHIAPEHAVVEAHYSVNWLEVLQMNAQSANQDVESAQQEVVEVEKILDSPRAGVDQERRSEELLADTELLLQ